MSREMSKDHSGQCKLAYRPEMSHKDGMLMNFIGVATKLIDPR